jgi:hypothetical protein
MPVRPRFRLRVAIALTWIVVAIGLTLVLGPLMGLRGWMWLFVHHVLCAMGAGWELREDWRLTREAARLPVADPEAGEAHSAQTRADS